MTTAHPLAGELEAFHAGDLPAADIDRVAAHLEHCPACEAVMQALDARSTAPGDPLRGLPRTAHVPGLQMAAVETPGTVLGGRYALAELLGEGGMGAVWRADQTEPVRRQVAVKLVKAGMDSRAVLARFDAERQALAVMDHPSIAKVFDAGTTPAGRPFFVMELVRGVPITRYCDDKRLTPRERLELFVPVCQAVQHAHQKGVIHRDIKPGNVLVAEYDGRPVPKVIDFGIAKATGGDRLTDLTLNTGLGAVVGTLEYMAPEQAVGGSDVDTRADVYALGVLLYELLTGTTPLDRKRIGQLAILEILRLVREHEPPVPSARLSTADTLPSIAANRQTEPSRLQRLLRGELDWVAMRALEKDRGRRYATANGLALDVQRYLANEPVEAGPPSWRYRARKFARRHRGPVAVAVGFVALLVAAVAVSTWQAVRATVAEGRAVENFKAAEAQRAKAERLYTISRLAVDRYGNRVASDTRLQAVPRLQRTLLTDAQEYYSRVVEEYADDPLLAADIARARTLLGGIAVQAGDLPGAVKYLDDARAAQEKLVADRPDDLDHPCDLMTTHVAYGEYHAARRDKAAAVAAFERAAAIGEGLLRRGAGHRRVRETLGIAYEHLGGVRNNYREYKPALAALQRCLELREELVQTEGGAVEHRRNLAGTMSTIGVAHYGLKPAGLPAARAAFARAGAMWAQLAADDPDAPGPRFNAASVLNNLANVAQEEGRPTAEVRGLFERAVREYEELVGRFPEVRHYRLGLAAGYDNLALRANRAGDGPGALEWSGKALVILDGLRKGGPDTQELLTLVRNASWNKAEALDASGDPAAAVAAWDAVLVVVPPSDTRTELLSLRAISQAAAGRHAEAAAEVAELTDPPAANRLVCFRGAEALAAAASAAGRDATLPPADRNRAAAGYADHAISLLRRAKKQGYLADRVGSREVWQSRYLNPLRNRADFRALLPREPAPRPRSRINDD